MNCMPMGSNGFDRARRNRRNTRIAGFAIGFLGAAFIIGWWYAIVVMVEYAVRP